MSSTLHKIEAVQILRCGKWNGTSFDVSDLDSMIEAFPQVGFQCPVLLGHSTTVGGEAYGWVERIFRKGEILYADLRDISTELYAKIKARKFDHVSIECFFNLERAGKTFKRVLKALALLGSETPAVSNLAPLRTVVNAARVLPGDRVLHFTLRMEDSPMTDVHFMTYPSEANLSPDKIIANRVASLIRAGQFSEKQYSEAAKTVLAEDRALARAWAAYTSVWE